MQVTQNVAELCALLIDELHGELPSRIFAALLNKGRSVVAQLVKYTSLKPCQVRHGLVVLLQHNLLFFYVDSETKVTHYEANPDAAYNQLRSGKILNLAEVSFPKIGPAVKDVMQNLLVLGQTRVSDLVAAYRPRIDHGLRASVRTMDHQAGADHVDQKSRPAVDCPIRSIPQLNTAICRLLESELVEVVHGKMFLSPADNVKEVSKEVKDKYFPAGIKGGKAKIEYDEQVAKHLRAVRDQSKSLRRKLENGGLFSSKKRRLVNGVASINGHGAEDKDEFLALIDPTAVIRINYEKCVVELRNRRLVQYANETLGENTGYVYGALLRLLSKNIPRCHKDPLMDFGGADDEDFKLPNYVSTLDILNHIAPHTDLSRGIGKPEFSSDVSSKLAERIRRRAPGNPFAADDEDNVEGPASAVEADDGKESDVPMDSDTDCRESYLNGTNGSSVKFAGSSNGVSSDRRADLRRHLLLLAESNQSFVRQCDHEEWTVDFEVVIRKLKEYELDVTIESSAGRGGLRLVHMLRHNGKLDERMSTDIALMEKKSLKALMEQLHIRGFVHVQEVPRDAKHDARRSLWLWYCDTDKSLNLILNKTYKTMLRCFQVLEVLRQNDQGVLSLTKRSDVRGREKDVMQKRHFDTYSKFLANERKLIGQITRLDDIVGALRDF